MPPGPINGGGACVTPCQGDSAALRQCPSGNSHVQGNKRLNSQRDASPSPCLPTAEHAQDCPLPGAARRKSFRTRSCLRVLNAAARLAVLASAAGVRRKRSNTTQ